MQQIQAIQKRNTEEQKLGIGNQASWHEKYKNSAYVYVGGLDSALSEGDLIMVFSQFGEVVDINLPKDEKTGEPMGFCFLAYEDQRSTNLAVDNFNGVKLGDRTIRVDHKQGYFRKVKTDDIQPIKSLLEIQAENENLEKQRKKEAKAQKKSEKMLIQGDSKKRKHVEVAEVNKVTKSVVGPVGPQKPRSEVVESRSVEPVIDEKDEERRSKAYNKEFWFDQNININIKFISSHHSLEKK
jgi:RNA recognition motif-containing protein